MESTYSESHKKYYESNKEAYKKYYQKNKERLKQRALERYYKLKLERETETPAESGMNEA